MSLSNRISSKLKKAMQFKYDSEFEKTVTGQLNNPRLKEAAFREEQDALVKHLDNLDIHKSNHKTCNDFTYQERAQSAMNLDAFSSITTNTTNDTNTTTTSTHNPNTNSHHYRKHSHACRHHNVHCMDRNGEKRTYKRRLGSL